MIRSVDRRVARHTRPGKHPHTRARAGSNQHGVVDRARMTRADVTSLAQDRRLRDEHALVRRAVRVVAGHASVAARRMLPQERAALFRMARSAQLGDRIAFPQQLHVRRAVCVMARRTLHLAFAHGHVSRAIELGDFVAVAARAHVLLQLGLQLSSRRFRGMDRVTCRAREVSRFVLAVVPERVFSAVVAGRAKRVDFLRFGFLEAPRLERIGRWILEVLARGPVTGFTALRSPRRPGIALSVVCGVDVPVVLLFVTGRAVRVAYICGAGLGGRSLRSLSRSSGLVNRGLFTGCRGNFPNHDGRSRNVRRRRNTKNRRQP
jgi:hypothetical protein